MEPRRCEGAYLDGDEIRRCRRRAAGKFCPDCATRVGEIGTWLMAVVASRSSQWGDGL